MARHLHGRYTILGKLADGGMAEIFLAVQHGAEGFEKPVVLKRILTQYSADPQFRNMLLDEAHISMSLQHSNIVQVLDLGVAGERSFLVLELVDGWDLERILQRALAAQVVWPPALGLYVVTQVCRALAYAHAKTRDGKPLEIVHRDISPNNVLISEHGEVKLADFGIAKAGKKREQTAAGVIKGKVAYMSPEQAMGAGLDRRSDVFSVGSMLYRMMTDKLPFDAGNDLESLLRVQKAQFAPPEQAKPTVGNAVSNIIMRAMRLAPSERYQSADEMLGDVERVLRNDFHSAGQTELKLWLEQLARRDEAEPIGKRRLGNDNSGVVRDSLGTDLSAGTSFELDDLEQVATGETEISLVSATPGGGPPPVPASAAGAAGGRAAREASDKAAAALAGGRRPAPRRRMGGFWLGAVLAAGGIFGIKYVIGWAQEQGVADKLGLGPDGAVRTLIGSAGGEGQPGAPPPAGAPSPPAGAAGAPAPPPAEQNAAATPPPGAPAPAPTADGAAAGAGAVVAAGEPAAADQPPAPGDKPAADDEPDEEALLKNADPNPENAVIGEEEAEALPDQPDKPAADAKRPAAASATPPAGAKAAARPAAVKPKAATVIIHIKTQPVGAVVRVKSRVLGRTPINLHFKSDNVYELTFVKSGYEPTLKKVTLKGPKDRSLAVSLRKRPAAKKSVGSILRMHR